MKIGAIGDPNKGLKRKVNEGGFPVDPALNLYVVVDASGVGRVQGQGAIISLNFFEMIVSATRLS